MKETEFIQKHPARGAIQQTCAYVETGAHKLKLISLRQHATVSEVRAQAQVLMNWLKQLDEELAKEP